MNRKELMAAVTMIRELRGDWRHVVRLCRQAGLPAQAFQCVGVCLAQPTDGISYRKDLYDEERQGYVKQFHRSKKVAGEVICELVGTEEQMTRKYYFVIWHGFVQVPEIGKASHSLVYVPLEVLEGEEQIEAVSSDSDIRLVG